jgi:alpha-tubulin suppressor-like RCC1 family protein
MALRRFQTIFASPLGTLTRSLTSTASSDNTLDHVSLLAWGSGHQGVLGQGKLIPQDEYEPVEIDKNNQLPPDIVGVGAGHFHSLAWTSDQLFSWGRNNEGQLGRHLASNEQDFSVAPSPAISLPAKYQIQRATGSGVATFVLTTDSSLLVSGSSKRGQLGLGSETLTTTHKFQQIHLPGKVLAVAAGWGHAAALVEDGTNTKMFTWGWPAHGRLGHSFATCPEDELEETLKRRCVFEPREVELLRGVKLSSIACGMDTTYAITQDGRLLSFGDNSLGQLGRPDVDGKNNFTAAPKDASTWEVCVKRESNRAKNVKFRKIAPGLGHCLAVTGGGSVISWGWNAASQVGLGEDADEKDIVYSPKLIFGVAKNRSAMIGAGRVHSVLITDELHQEKAEMPTAFGRTWPFLSMAYTWGSAANGRLGTGTYENAPFPELLTSLDGEMMLDVACGMDHTLLLVSRPESIRGSGGPLTAFSIEE